MFSKRSWLRLGAYFERLFQLYFSSSIFTQNFYWLIIPYILDFAKSFFDFMLVFKRFPWKKIPSLIFVRSEGWYANISFLCAGSLFLCETSFNDEEQLSISKL